MRTVAFFALALVAFAGSASPASAAGEDGELDAVHHTSDGYYLDFSPLPIGRGGKLELPRLFLVRRADGSLGFDAFGSSTAAVLSGRYVIGAHGDGDGAHSPAAHAADPYAEDALAQEIAEERPDPNGLTVEELSETNAEEILGETAEPEAAYDAPIEAAGGAEILIDLSISRHLVFILLTIVILLLLFLPLAGKYKKGVGRTSAPRGLLQNMLETLVIYVRDEIARPNLGAKTYKYLPYLLTVFFFILVANLAGLVPFGATATANITVTAVLALFTFFVTQLAGTKDYWMHILWPPGIPWFVKPILVPIEIMGLFTKPFALAVRLFANMTAGHLVILNLIGLIFIVGGMSATAGYATSVPAIGLTLFVYALELLVAFIQAYVFTILSALFIGMATAEHEHDHDHAEDHGLTPHGAAVSESNGQAHHKEHDRTVGSEAVMA
ncbi:F0F1 ATP synthase subunit A [Rubrivirga litoralis]|uniref:ATP synthase subunit a n=1 Tax=Rubrivirga litoralis TaxID=3075598 RepID=A0ABU3BME7_9BACT|nr:F0F1 ATP synthase subunit A [Rubrivirga sp. F394]MDT0630396.1 F0F1 ATP synthase subunit A [Rubrivirga sp. F394]